MVVAETTVCPLVKACGDFAEFQGSLDLVSSLNESAVLLLAFALGWCVFRPTLHVVKPAAGEIGFVRSCLGVGRFEQAVALVEAGLNKGRPHRLMVYSSTPKCVEAAMTGT
eukprot:s92_g9.t2